MPVYILDDERAGKWKHGASSKWWLHHSLTALQKKYKAFGHDLRLYKGDTLTILESLVKAHNVETICFNKHYEPYNRKMEKDIFDHFGDKKNFDVDVVDFNGNILWEPWAVQNKTGGFFKVFTPYFRHCDDKYRNLRKPVLNDLSENLVYKCPDDENGSENTLSVEQLDLVDPNLDVKKFKSMWNPGESGALDKLEEWLPKVGKYNERRNFPGVKGTSRLSPHYHFGELSPYLAWHKIKTVKGQEKSGVEAYLWEIGWREFSYYLLYHFPEFPDANFQPKFDKFKWTQDKGDVMLQKWKDGQTGYPIVDAAMRELKACGWQHNRCRMITASFLVKDLFIDWRKGEEHFHNILVDADLASNSAGWQWVAGSGADPSPYFRIFNPKLQSEKFDKDGKYISKWCPELEKMPAKYIHTPWEAPVWVLKAAEVTLGETYPRPMIDHDVAKGNAMDQWNRINAK